MAPVAFDRCTSREIYEQSKRARYNEEARGTGREERGKAIIIRTRVAAQLAPPGREKKKKTAKKLTDADEVVDVKVDRRHARHRYRRSRRVAPGLARRRGSEGRGGKSVAPMSSSPRHPPRGGLELPPQRLVLGPQTPLLRRRPRGDHAAEVQEVVSC